MPFPPGFAEEGHEFHVMVDILTSAALIRRGDDNNMRAGRIGQKEAR